jgi:hypothetical protein
LARKRVSEIAKPEPLEFMEDDDTTVAFCMPRRFSNLSKPEQEELKNVQLAVYQSGAAIIEHANGALGNDDYGTEAFKTKLDELTKAAFDLSFSLATMILPGITRDRFDKLSQAQFAEIVTEFRSGPFPEPTEGAPTSGSAAI